MRDHLDKLESKSVHILREAYAAFGNLCMLWSIGKDSTSFSGSRARRFTATSPSRSSTSTHIIKFPK